MVETGLFNSGRVRPAEFDKGVEGNETGINSVEDMKRMAEEYGFDLKTTLDEVAEMALAGIPNGDFWLLEHTEESKAKVQRRAEMIINNDTGARVGRLTTHDSISTPASQTTKNK